MLWELKRRIIYSLLKFREDLKRKDMQGSRWQRKNKHGRHFRYWVEKATQPGKVREQRRTGLASDAIEGIVVMILQRPQEDTFGF